LFRSPALALDLMDPFRPLIADSVVLTAINTRMITLGDFIRSDPSVALKPSGRKGEPFSSGAARRLFPVPDFLLRVLTNVHLCGFQ
jgi:CRISPR/Cas system-associated endonuclease Cas1